VSKSSSRLYFIALSRPSARLIPAFGCEETTAILRELSYAYRGLAEEVEESVLLPLSAQYSPMPGLESTWLEWFKPGFEYRPIFLDAALIRTTTPRI